MAERERPPSGRAKKIESGQTRQIVRDARVKPLIDETLASLDRGEGTPWRKGEALERIKTDGRTVS
jgi:hypothetical protein